MPGIRIAVDASQTTQAAREANRAFDSIGRGAKGLERDIDRVRHSFNAGFGRMTGAVMSLQGAIAGLGIGYMGKQIFEAGRNIDATRKAFEQITGSAKGTREEFAFLRDVADDLGQNFYALIDPYQKIAAAAKGTNLEGQQTREIFQGIVQASATLGLSADETGGALNALSQMISKGNVQAEELRGQLGERLPGAFQIAARSMNMTTQELSKALENGEVLADDLLPKLADQLQKEFSGEVADSVRAANKLNESWEDLQVAFADAGFTEAVATAMQNLATGMDNFVEDNEDLIAQNLPEHIQNLAIAGTWVLDVFQGIGRTFRLAGKTVALIALEIEREMLVLADGIINGPILAINKLIDLYNKVPALPDLGNIGFTGLGDAIYDELTVVNGAIEQAKQDLIDTLEGKFVGREMREAIKASTKEVEEQSFALEKITVTAKRAGEETEKFGETFNKYFFKAGYNAPEGIGRTYDYSKEMQALEDRAGEAAEEVETVFDQAARNIQDSWSNLLSVALQGDLDNIENILDGLAGSLADTAANAIVGGFTGGFAKSQSGGGGIVESLMAGLQGGLSTGNIAVAAGAAGLSLLSGALGDNGPSYGELLGKELRKMQAELAKNTEELRANTQAILSGEGRWTQASIRRGLRGPLSAESVMRDRSLFENFALPVGVGPTAGGGSVQFPEWRKSTGGVQTQNIMNQLLQSMEIDKFYSMMQEVVAGNVEEFIREVSEAGGLAAEDMADIIAEFTEGADLERNREVARTVAAEMRSMFAEIENAAAKTASSMQDSLGPLGSWASRISTWQSDVTEADRAMMEFNQQFGSLREELDRLRQVPGIDPQIISMYEEAIENAERLGIAIEEHFNQAARNVLQESARWLADLQGEISPLEQAVYEMNERFDRYREQLLENNASQEQLNRLSEQRAEAEEWLRKNYEDTARAANDSARAVGEFADALSAMEIRQRQAQIAGRSGQFQLQQIALDFGWYSKYGGIPGQAEIRRGIDWASQASPEELRAKATKFGITTEELLENVSMLDDALDGMGASAEDAASASERAADAMRRQIDALNEQIQAVESIQGLLTNIRGGGDLAPVTSMAFFENRYQQLLEEAQGGGAREVENFTQFARKYLEFAQSYGGDYAGVAGSVIEDLETVENGITGGKTLSDLYAELAISNDRLEYIRENTRETVTTMADAFTKALEEAIGTSGDKPWAENWNMSKWLSDFQSGMGTAIENWREDPSGFEVLKGFLGQGSGMDISKAVGGGWQAIFRGEGGSLIDRFKFASPDEITPEMLWSLAQDNPQLREYWKNALYPGTDINKYWLGAQHGATVSGPESGFYMPMQFHGKEHITPDSEMGEVKELLAAILSVLESDSGKELSVNVDGKRLLRVLLDRAKYDGEFQKMINKSKRAA
jgi:tape measure domain-containing protein